MDRRRVVEHYRFGCFTSWRMAGAVVLLVAIVLGFVYVVFGWWS